MGPVSNPNYKPLIVRPSQESPINSSRSIPCLHSQKVRNCLMTRRRGSRHDPRVDINTQESSSGTDRIHSRTSPIWKSPMRLTSGTIRSSLVLTYGGPFPSSATFTHDVSSPVQTAFAVCQPVKRAISRSLLIVQLRCSPFWYYTRSVSTSFPCGCGLTYLYTGNEQSRTRLYQCCSNTRTDFGCCLTFRCYSSSYATYCVGEGLGISCCNS